MWYILAIALILGCVDSQAVVTETNTTWIQDAGEAKANASEPNLSVDDTTVPASPAPTSTQTPVPDACKPQMQCSVSSCIDDKQTMTCIDAAGCGPSTTEQQTCDSLDHLIFAEVLYDAPGIESDHEWVKIYNPTGSRLQIKNWSVADNSGQWKFSAMIREKSYIAVARDSEGFRNLSGCDADVSGLTRALNNDGDYLILRDNSGNEIDVVAWNSGYKNSHANWNITAAPGESLRRISLTADSGTAADWAPGPPQPCEL